MKDELSARRVVMRSALSCCAQWAPVVPPAAQQAASAVAALTGAPAGGTDPAVSPDIGKKPLAS